MLKASQYYRLHTRLDANLTPDSVGARGHGHGGDGKDEYEWQECHVTSGVVQQHRVSSRGRSSDAFCDDGAETSVRCF